jgi:23S rRNA (uracil1939-C5)-methyltransferase
VVLKLQLEGLVHGGDTLARQDGRVVFVSGGSPGDLVEAEITSEHGNFHRARVVRLLAPGPGRVEAPCALVDRCGGCPLQRTSAAVQRQEKERLVRDALERQGGLARGSFELLPLVESPLALRYRRRARLHKGEQGAWGFAGSEGGREGEGEGDGDGEGDREPGRRAGRTVSRIVPVETCLLFEPALQLLYTRVTQALRAVGTLPGVVDLGLDVSSSGAGALDLRTLEAPTRALLSKAEALWADVRGVKGLTLGPVGAAQTLGQPVLVDAPFAGRRARLRSRPDLFAQANRACVPLLQALVLEALGPRVPGRVLELFCGAGTLTLPLLEAGATVLGVESAGPALQLLRATADEAGLSKALRVVAGDAGAIVHELARAGERFDAVVLDPPRTGAAETVTALAGLEVARVVYVSCAPVTLARDAALLAARGYRLSWARPLELFPQTAHVEVVAVFERAG